jgi:hypothetical protein
MRCNGCHQLSEGVLVDAPLPDLPNTLWVRPPRGWFTTTAFLDPGDVVGNEDTGAEGQVGTKGGILAIVVCERCMALGRVVKTDDKDTN